LPDYLLAFQKEIMAAQDSGSCNITSELADGTAPALRSLPPIGDCKVCQDRDTDTLFMPCCECSMRGGQYNNFKPIQQP
jgi:hypothetical protein